MRWSAAIETERWGRTLLPHVNAKANLALLHYERGDLDPAENVIGRIAAGRPRVGVLIGHLATVSPTGPDRLEMDCMAHLTTPCDLVAHYGYPIRGHAAG